MENINKELMYLSSLAFVAEDLKISQSEIAPEIDRKLFGELVSKHISNLSDESAKSLVIEEFSSRMRELYQNLLELDKQQQLV